MLLMMVTAVGKRVKDLRLSRGLKQKQLAQPAHVTRGWLSLVESGKIQNPGGERLDRVARILGVSSRYLLTGQTLREEDEIEAKLAGFRRFPKTVIDQLDRIGDALFYEDVPTESEAAAEADAETAQDESPDETDSEASS